MDLPYSTQLKVLLFADDTTLIAKGKNLSEYKKLQKIFVWFRAKKMLLFPSKRVYTIFHPKPNDIPWENNHVYIDENETEAKNPLNIKGGVTDFEVGLRI